jgi:hypothetical protein
MRTHKMAGIVTLALATLYFLSACAPSAAPPAPCAGVLAAVEESQPFSELVPLSDKLLRKYLNIDAALLSDAAMSMDGTRVTAEQIVVLTAADEKALATVRAALSAYLDSFIAQYRDYQPGEVPKLENAVLQTHNLQIALIVSADWTAAKTALDGVWE